MYRIVDLYTCIFYFASYISFTNIPFISAHDTASTVLFTLSLHDALPISASSPSSSRRRTIATLAPTAKNCSMMPRPIPRPPPVRSEEHTSELQSRFDLVCRLLLEKKNIDGLTIEKEKIIGIGIAKYGTDE